MLNRLLDFLLPPLCLKCDAPTGAPQALCPACWKAIHFIAPPCCALCGMPFDVPVEAGTQCGECLAYPPVYTRARSVMIYDDASKPLPLGLKHHDRTHAVPGLAALMFRAGGEFLPSVDLIVPVPLHRWRLFSRRYNQSAMLAQAIGRLSGKPVGVDTLQRIRATPIQGHLNREERRKNIAGAIRLHPRHVHDVKNRHVVLIDDVMTTGATVNECSRILLAKGAAEISVLTLARTRNFRI